MKKLRKDHPTTFILLNEEKTQSMSALNEAHMSPPVLSLSNSTGHMIFDIDACTVQAGCVPLQQLEDGTTKPIDN